EFLARCVARFMKKYKQVHCLIGGQGPSEEMIRAIFLHEGPIDRLHLPGVFRGKDLASAYHAMDVFVFASHSETQGLVLDEAMACAVPVVAVDAPGVREVVDDGINGRLLRHENIMDFVSALEWALHLNRMQRVRIKKACRRTAGHFSMDTSAQRALDIYASLCTKGFSRQAVQQSYWESKLRLMQAQWKLVKNLTKAAGALIGLPESLARS
ncbi:MAG: glycosyltransferase, partial [Candidatus Omnitrophica bacterium]|nr:glycosyltransferase [Candidatus Omnitrophota bacterium]